MKGVDVPLGNIASQKRIGLMRPEDFQKVCTSVSHTIPYWTGA